MAQRHGSPSSSRPPPFIIATTDAQRRRRARPLRHWYSARASQRPPRVNSQGAAERLLVTSHRAAAGPARPTPAWPPSPAARLPPTLPRRSSQSLAMYVDDAPPGRRSSAAACAASCANMARHERCSSASDSPSEIPLPASSCCSRTSGMSRASPNRGGHSPPNSAALSSYSP